MSFFQDRRKHFSFESASYFHWCNLLPKAVKELRLLNIFLNSKHFWLMFYFVVSAAFKDFVKGWRKVISMKRRLHSLKRKLKAMNLDGDIFIYGQLINTYLAKEVACFLDIHLLVITVVVTCFACRPFKKKQNVNRSVPKVMEEILRVIKPNGYCILQVPIARALDTTRCDANVVADEERLEKFGQKDHVRLYGNDYTSLLTEAGFDVDEVKWQSLKKLNPLQKNRYGLIEKETLFVCKPHIKEALKA